MVKTLDILDCSGARVGEFAVPESLSSVIELNKGAQAVHDAVVAYLAGARSGSACTKTRGLVRGGGAKPWRQKARAGSNRSPVWVGGGTIFGPQPRSFAKKMNKKVLALALKRALAERIEEGDVMVLDKFALPDHKTRSAYAVLKNLKIQDDTIMLSMTEFDEASICATGNIPNLVVRRAATVNVYELLRFKKLVFCKDALDAFIGRLA